MANYLAAVVIIISLLVLLGWQFDLGFLKRPLPNLVAMNPTTAFLFILCGFTFLILNNRFEHLFMIKTVYFTVCLVIIISLLCILDFIFPINIRLDRILFSGKLVQDALENIPNRMAPNTCVSFFLSGAGLLLLHYETAAKRIPAHYFAILVAVLSLFSILGYLYNVPSLYGMEHYIPMAIHTAVSFFLLSVAVLFSNPAKGIMAFLTGKLIGSSTMRLLIPYAVLIPAISGFVILLGLRAGFYNAAFSYALLVLCIIIVFALLIRYNAMLLNKRDKLRHEMEEQVKGFNDELKEQVKEKTAEIVAIFERLTDGFIALDRNYCYTYANKKIGELVQQDHELLIGKNIWELFPDAVGSVTYQAFMLAMKEQHYIVASDYYPPLNLWQENHIYPSPEGLSVFIRDITEHKKAEEAVKALENEILEQKIQAQRKISRAIIKAQEEEKNHIGKELHDNINQILASAKIYLSLAANKNKDIREILAYPMELIDSTVEEIRLLSSKQVTPLKNINLKDLLQGLIETLENGGVVKAGFSYSVSEASITDELKLNIYRIIQGAVNNIIKHAGAQHVSISIQEKDNAIEITATDDGCGFDLKSPRNGIGISNMINRVESFNGKVEIMSTAGNGCTVHVLMPL
jgi:PAS domain S-box-containing protein